MLIQTLAITGDTVLALNNDLRPITVEDVQGGPDLQVRQTDPEFFLAAQGDFDGDGRQDMARLMANEDNQTFVIQVQWGDPLLESTLFHREPLSKITRAALVSVPSGKLVHICKPERDGCPDADRTETEIPYQGIAMIHFGGTQVVYAWNGETMIDYWIAD